MERRQHRDRPERKSARSSARAGVTFVPEDFSTIRAGWDDVGRSWNDSAGQSLEDMAALVFPPKRRIPSAEQDRLVIPIPVDKLKRAAYWIIDGFNPYRKENT